MKVVILAGGLPSTLNEENEHIPKPMVTIGERPIVWHIMKLYSYYGFKDFIICTGYRSEVIKDYFLNYYLYGSDITVDLKTNDVTIHNHVTEEWNVTIVDTGLRSTTAERVKYIEKYIDEEDFLVSYGDCISDININKLVKCHKESKKIMTIAVAKPTGRNTILKLDEETMVSAKNKDLSKKINAWVNACNIVLNKKIFEGKNLLHDRLEGETLEELVEEGETFVYKHTGFWMPVETMRDKALLESLWISEDSTWKKWED